MTNLFTIEDSLENKISYYHLALFLMFLPFDRFYSQLVVVSFVLHTLIHVRLRKRLTTPKWQNLLLCSVFLLNVVGLIWSHDQKEGIKDCIRQLTILVFPIILSLSALDLQKYKKNLLILFGLTCVATILYLYFDAFRIILYNKLPLETLFSRSFINHNFSEPIGLHATYLSVYVALAIAVFLSMVSGRIDRTILLHVLCIVVLMAGLLQLAVKSVLVATIIIILQTFFFRLGKGAKRTRFILVTIMLAVLVVFGVTRIDAFKGRYLTEFKGDLADTSANNRILEPRLARWKSALPLVAHAPLIGHGSGSEKRLLKEAYFSYHLYDSYVHELNAHNQYLSIQIKTGLFGLLVFFFTLYAGFLSAWRERNVIFISFMILIGLVSLSENILDVNKGIFFYAFFFSLFAKTSKPFDELFRFTDKRLRKPVVN